MNLTGDLKKIFLAGVGATAITAEKGSQILKELVNKGELTVEQGKELNQELRHTIRNQRQKPETSGEEKDSASDEESVTKMLSSLSEDQMAQLKNLLASFQKENTRDSSDSSAPENPQQDKQ